MSTSQPISGQSAGNPATNISQLAPEPSTENVRQMSYADFVKFPLSLYHGPTVGIKIGSTTYDVSKTLLCARSPYFAAMLNGKFKEAEEQSAELEEVAGVVSNHSFELFLQYFYIGQLNRAAETQTSWISALIEFARLADMLGLSNAGSFAAERIRTTIVANLPSKTYAGKPEENILHIIEAHVEGASYLPLGHPVRKVLAQAVVYAFIRLRNFKFSNQLETLPFFVADVLEEVKIALKGVCVSGGKSY